MRGGLLGLLAIWLLVAVRVASAAEAPIIMPGTQPFSGESRAHEAERRAAQVFIEATACVALQSALLTALRTEISANAQPIVLLESAAPMRPEQGLVIANCDLKGGELKIEVVAQTEGRRDAFPLDVSDIPIVARPRTAAVAMVEWALTLLTPKAADTSPTATVDTQQSQASAAQKFAPVGPAAPIDTAERSVLPALPTSKASLNLALGAQARVVGPRSLATRGGWLSLRSKLAQRWQLAGQVSYETVSSESLLGNTRLHWVSGAFGGAYRGERIPWVVFSGRIEVSDAVIVSQSRLGLTEPKQHELLVLAGAQLDVSVPLLNGWSLETAIGGGYLIRGVHYTAAGSNVFDLSRGLYLARLGLGYEL